MDIIPAEEEEYDVSDYETASKVLEIFNNNAKERDKAILERCIINGENQREVAKDIGCSQSYISRIVTAIEENLKSIALNGEYKKITTYNALKEKGEKKMVKYSKTDYIYIIQNYPQLANKEIGKLMGVSYQSVNNYRNWLKQGKFEGVEIPAVNKELLDKINKYVLVHKTEKVKKPEIILEEIHENRVKELKKQDDFIKELDKIFPPKTQEPFDYKPTPKRVIPIVEPIISIDNPEISKKEIIILNNKISITSNKNETSSLVLGIYQLLENIPPDAKVKLDIAFEVSK
jgi:transposase